jgi:phage repressor protein C with HTH and peptisase S24 domain
LKEDTINQRISLLVQELDSGNKLAFSKRIGMSNQGLGEIIGERQSTPSFPKLTQMLRALPQVRMEWLLLGEGEMLKSAEAPKNSFVYAAPSALAAEPEPRFYSQQAGENTEAPLYNLPTAASYLGQGLSQERAEPDGVLSLPTWLLKRGNHAVFPVIGDSMEPTFFAKDYVICRQIQRPEWFDLRPDNVAVIVSEARGLQLKRLSFRPAENLVRCKSDNRQHLSYNLELSEVLEVWRFEWRITASATNLTESFEDRMRHLEEGQEDMRYLIEQLMDSRELRRMESRRNTKNEE